MKPEQRRFGGAGCRRRVQICRALTAVILVTSGTAGLGQSAMPEPLDPTATVKLDPVMPRRSLTEQYIWTARAPNSKPHGEDLSAHDFRVHFRVDSMPHGATLYLAGPREATVYLNGTLLGHVISNPDQPINFRVFHLPAVSALHTGDNVLAIRAVRGHGTIAVTNNPALQQLARGEVLAVKLIPAAFGDDKPGPLLRSDLTWRSRVSSERDTGQAWYTATLDDASWPAVHGLGSVDGNIDFRQWSADAGMYGWPGYVGMSNTLRTFALPAAAVLHVFPGQGSFAHVDSLRQLVPVQPLVVSTDNTAPTDGEAPSLLLDFGREVAGRLFVQSDSANDSVLSIAYGESELEAMATGETSEQRGGNYLGTNLLDVPAHGVARGPKSAFRYVRVRFLRVGAEAKFPAIRLEGITYPVAQRASFSSSDPLLNRIYETAAYTAHLCMQDSVWDAPKRDRGRWAGDLDVEAPVIYSSFGDAASLESTLAELASDTPADKHVNGIPSYTALWLTTLARLYERSGNRSFVAAHHADVLAMLARLDDDLDPATGLLKAKQRGWGFVDWSPGLYAYTPEVTIGTTLQYLRAYQAAPALLHASGDEANAKRYAEASERLAKAARAKFFPAGVHTLGATWQLNALAVLTGVSQADDRAIWSNVFANVKQQAPTDPVISPYFNDYLLDAMSRTGHPREALDWMRAYWGGMIAQGATSFWESYDLRWPKTDFHLSLQADGTSGFFVSLAHGWSSGPVAWIDENILGVRPLKPGYAAVSVRPELLGLTFAKGTVPTPHGMISVELDVQGLSVDLPSGVESADVVLPVPAGVSNVSMNGVSSPDLLTEKKIHLEHSGKYAFAWR